MKGRMKKWMLLGAALVLQPAAACAQEDEPRVHAVALVEAGDDLAQRLAALEAKGASGFVAVARPGEETLLVTMGAADAATGRDYTLDTQFDVGSITKPLTGLVASQLMEEGVIAPDATLADYFDGVPADKAGITVEQLLTHSAGFHDAHGFDLKPMDREAMLAEVFATDLLFAPGDRYRYSNTGFSLVAAIVEKVTGEAFETVALRMFAAAGMDSTGYWQAYDEARSDHDPERGPVSQASWGGLSPVSWALTGNGGMVSSANDLLRLGQALLGGDLPEEAAARWSAARISEGEDGYYYGYGLAVRRSPKLGDIYWHNGGNPAFRTEWWNIADSGTSIVVHLNDGDAMIDDVLMATLEAVTGLEMQRQVEGGAPDEFGPLGDGPAHRVAAAFAEAIVSDDRDVWEAFVRAHVHPGLVGELPMEQHLSIFAQFHEGVAGKTLVGAAEEDETLWVGFAGDDGERTAIGLDFEPHEGTPKLVGIRTA